MPIATGHEREELEAALDVILFFLLLLFLDLGFFFYLFGCDGEMIMVLIGLFHLGKGHSGCRPSCWSVWYKG